MNSHVVVIDPGCRVAEIEGFNHLQTLSPLPFTYHLPAMFGTRSMAAELENISSIKGVVIFGSGASVHDPLPWINEISVWLKQVIEFKVPVAGFCFGHQLLAKMFGGVIGYVREDQFKLKGLREIEIHPNSVFKVGKGQVVISHQETVVEKPSCMEVLASSELVMFDGLRHRDLPVYSFQSHPEATQAFLENGDITGVSKSDLVYGHSIVSQFLQSL